MYGNNSKMLGISSIKSVNANTAIVTTDADADVIICKI